MLASMAQKLRQKPNSAPLMIMSTPMNARRVQGEHRRFAAKSQGARSSTDFIGLWQGSLKARSVNGPMRCGRVMIQDKRAH